MIPMCASSGIFYGKKGIRYDNSGIKPNPNVTFIFSVNENESEIEGLDKPELDDLILNVGTPELEDGCFYRVVRINENNIETTRLTLQGTGGGGGGGGSVPGGSTNFTISMASQLFTFPSTATEMNVSFRGNYNGDQENAIMSVRFHKSGEAEPFYIYTGDMPFNEYVPIDLYEYRHLFAETKT
jgi:hypothetical protein